MNLLFLLVVGAGAAWVICRALIKEGKDGRCAGCTKVCESKNSCTK